MSTEKTTTLKLKDPLINPDGTNLKDASKENRSQEELLKLKPSEITASYPDFTVGQALVTLINNKNNAENIEEIAKLSRLIVKIRNKMLTGKGEWHIEKQELLDLEEIFKKVDPKTLNINLHGQVYNKIKDLLLQVTS